MRKNVLKKGFTLLELIVVIIIIGVLASLALPRLFSIILMSKTAEAMQTFTTIRSAMEVCRLQNGTFAGCFLNSTSTNLTIGNPSQSAGARWLYWTNEVDQEKYHINACYIEDDPTKLCKGDNANDLLVYMYQETPGNNSLTNCIFAVDVAGNRFRKFKPVGLCPNL